MRYMLDTDICRYLIKGCSEQLLKNLIAHEACTICISSITYAELLFDAACVHSKTINAKIDAIIQKVDMVHFDEEAAAVYANIRCELEKNGTTIGNMDMLIAACALSSNAVLITNNEKHFTRIPNLHVENWTKD